MPKAELRCFIRLPKTSLWRGGASLFLTPEKDAAEGTGIGVEFIEWRGHWQESEKHQEQHRRLESQELRKQERSSSPFEVLASKRAAARCTVRSESFRRSFGSVLERILTFIHKLEMYRTWPTNAGTRFSSLSQKYHQCASDCSLGEMAGVAKGTCRYGLEDQVLCDLGRLLQVL